MSFALSYDEGGTCQIQELSGVNIHGLSSAGASANKIGGAAGAAAAASRTIRNSTQKESIFPSNNGLVIQPI